MILVQVMVTRGVVEGEGVALAAEGEGEGSEVTVDLVSLS